MVEETYEVLDAIESEDPAALREELGDLLLQVLFHARLAEELPENQRFSVQDVAADLAAKLVRRHPHVFAPDAGPLSAGEVNENWERNKAAEKQRTSVLDGVPMALPSLALASKLVSRARRNGLADVAETIDTTDPAVVDEALIGEQLLTVVARASAAGIDAETALRRRANVLAAALRSAELRSVQELRTAGLADEAGPAR